MSRDLAFTLGAVLAISLLLGIFIARTETRIQDLETELYNLQHPSTKIKPTKPQEPPQDASNRSV